MHGSYVPLMSAWDLARHKKSVLWETVLCCAQAWVAALDGAGLSVRLDLASCGESGSATDDACCCYGSSPPVDDVTQRTAGGYEQSFAPDGQTALAAGREPPSQLPE
jgi:hypothetical protein